MDGSENTIQNRSLQLKLTPTSYIVLGLLERGGEATPYELKQMVSAGLGDFWSLQHAQLYTEPDRLAAEGLVELEQEQHGRRRKRCRITARGRAALDAWRGQPTSELAELRDPGLLQLFFGTDPRALAETQLRAHEAKLAEYKRLEAAAGDAPASGPLLALQAGIGHEREWIRFWSKVRKA
jgi:PadR family transcriptional regulator, regulatory protein AphA